MATDSHGMGIELPADSTKIHQFPGVTRLAMERVAELLAGGMTPGMIAAAAAAAEDAVAEEIAAADLVRGDTPGIPSTPAIDQVTKYVQAWVDSAYRVAFGITNEGVTDHPGGLDIGGTPIRSIANDQYLSGTVDPNGRVAEDALGRDGRVPDTVLAAWAARFPSRPEPTRLTVKKDGTGNHTTVTAAIAAALAAGATKASPFEIVIYPGKYDEISLLGEKTPGGVYLTGINRDTCILHGELPASATDATVALTSTVDLFDPAQLANLTITGRNVRYPVHYEGAGRNPNSWVKAINCHIEHYGNEDMKAWRIANPGSGMSAGTVWNSYIAWGEGAASGVEVDIDRCTLRGRSPFYLHGSTNHTKPHNHRIRNSRLIGIDMGGQPAGSSINPIGSGTDDELTITDTVIEVNHFNHQDSPWQTILPENQYADHYEIRMILNGCSVVGWTTTNRGKALRITSAATAAPSSVRVSGTAADALMGTDGLWKFRDGGGGLAGYAYGYWDISGIGVGGSGTTQVDNTLGRRLGDCTTTAKTLNVTLNGGAPVAVVFSGNHTADTNATILATINAALGAAGTASEYLVTQGERYPQVQDKERVLPNTGAAGIPRWAAVKYSTTGRGVELFGTADPATAFVGVALEPLAPGQTGRILTEGRMKFDQLYGLTGGIAAGQAISLSGTTAGGFTAGSAKQVATGVIADWAQFKGAK